VSPFLQGIAWLLVFQCIGEGASQLFGWPVPGPVVGMLGLFVALRMRGRIPDALAISADGLARHLSLLFVPAGVGVMLHFGRLADEWVPIVAAILGSTVLTIAAASWTFATLMNRRGPSLDERASDP